MNHIQEINQTIQYALQTGATKFYIYPFGNMGMCTKDILNKCYGIQEEGLIDDTLSEYNPLIQRTDEVVHLGGGKDTLRPE